MSEVVLQTIVEKLIAIEIALLKDTNPVKEETIQAILKEIKLFKSEMAKLPLEFEKSSEKCRELLQNISALNFRLDNPLEHQIKHKHYLNKGIWIAVGLFIICFFFLYGWISSCNSKNAFEANDIKYRYLKVNGNGSLLKAIYSTDSLFYSNKDFFIKKVVEKERDLTNQYELSRIANEKKRVSKPSNHFKAGKIPKAR
ncbi:MAG TPA: hypothetical protein VMY77_08235 [Chitinophagaceae bacterium]|nr:hypothetical protein [Chitinophagaceae bacterium]